MSGKKQLSDKLNSGRKYRHGQSQEEVDHIRSQAVEQHSKKVDQPKTHSLLMYPLDIELLRDYVHLQKVSGKYYYTQCDAIHDALELLVKQVGEVPPRPEEVRAKERKKTGRRRQNTPPEKGQKSAPEDDDLF